MTWNHPPICKSNLNLTISAGVSVLCNDTPPPIRNFNRNRHSITIKIQELKEGMDFKYYLVLVEGGLGNITRHGIERHQF